MESSVACSGAGFIRFRVDCIVPVHDADSVKTVVDVVWCCVPVSERKCEPADDEKQKRNKGFLSDD